MRNNVSKEIVVILVLVIINLHVFFQSQKDVKRLNKEIERLMMLVFMGLICGYF
jgi:hypothetical protein